MPLNRLVLVINAVHEPLDFVPARRALKLLFKGRAVVEVLSPYVVHTSHIDIPLPSVVRLAEYRYIPRYNRTVSRKGILLRDGNICQYCGDKFSTAQLTLDHVVPRSRSGQNTWENMVSCCYPCNNLKGDRTPEEAGMKLLHRPIRLTIHSKHRLLARDQEDAWGPYLFK